MKSYVVKVIFLGALISSVLYALYLKGKNNLVYETVYTYFAGANNEPVSLKLFTYLLIGYSKKIGFIWLFGNFLLTIPLSLLMSYLVVFTYGFTISTLILLYGGKGILGGLLLCGPQAVIVIAIVLYINHEQIKNKSLKLKRSIDWMKLGMISGGIILATLLDLMSILNFEFISKLMG